MHISQTPQQRVAKARAARFPPPMWGRDREGGGDEAPSAKVLLRKDPRSENAGSRIRWSPIAKNAVPVVPLSLPHMGGGNAVAPLCPTTGRIRIQLKDACTSPDISQPVL